MKKNLNFRISLALFLAVAPLGATAQQILSVSFNDTFSNGSTVNQAYFPPTPTNTSYQTYQGLTNGGWGISSGDLWAALPNTASVLGEVVALWTNSPAELAAVGDHIDLEVAFINTSNIMSGLDSGNSSLLIGLFNSGGVAPNQGNIVLSTGNTAGGTQNWIGYDARLLFGGSDQVYTRPAQTPNGSTSQNQDLMFNNASSSQAFNNPGATLIGNRTFVTNLVAHSLCTLQLVITLSANNALTISNALYDGVGTGTTPFFSQAYTTNGTPQPTSFDGMAIGWRNPPAPARSAGWTFRTSW